MVEPSKCSLDPPAPRQQDEPAGFLGAQDDRQDEWEATGDLPEQAPTVSTIDPDLTWLLAEAGPIPEELMRPVAILHAGDSDEHDQPRTQGLSQDVAFAPVDLLARIKATFSWRGGPFDALVIQATGG